MKYGYAWVSTGGQSVATKVAALTAAQGRLCLHRSLR